MQEKKYLIDEPGHFWWRDEKIAEGDFAPANHVTGQLVIGHDGYVKLDLNGLLPTEMHAWEQIFNSEARKVPRQIQGILKKSGNHVLLVDAVRVGGQANSSRFSYEKYFASLCLVGKAEFPRNAALPKFSSFDVDMSGYEDWLEHGTLKVDLRQRTFAVKGKVVRDLAFNTAFGKLTFKQNTEFPDSGGLHLFSLKMREFVTLSITHKKSVNAEHVRDQHSKLQELLILLTDSHHSLAWPIVQLNRGKKRYTLYFHRSMSSASPPERYDMPTLFNQFKENFGEIFSTWSAKRETFGAGFYGYASTRREMKLYVENRFANLIQGLESFHRTKYGDQPAAPEFQERVKRILEQVKQEDDKTWLDGKLQYAGEPTLATRLFEMFQELPLKLRRRSLKDFCFKCVSVRNDLAHLGGRRTRESSSNYLQEIEKLSGALTFMYHMILLREIGIDDDTIYRWLYKSYKSFSLKFDLVQANLLPQEAVNGKFPK